MREVVLTLYNKGRYFFLDRDSKTQSVRRFISALPSGAVTLHVTVVSGEREKRFSFRAPDARSAVMLSAFIIGNLLGERDLAKKLLKEYEKKG